MGISGEMTHYGTLSALAILTCTSIVIDTSRNA